MSSKTSEKFTNVNVSMSEKGNALLTNAARDNGRSKKKEAASRLEHHLRVFGSNSKWTEIVLEKR